jgi:hypothetical protein
MAALYSFLFIIFVSVIIIRVGAKSYEFTGLSSGFSMFQAQSAFSAARLVSVGRLRATTPSLQHSRRRQA